MPYITGPVGALAVLAIVLFLVLKGKIRTEREFRTLEAENEQLRAENTQLRLGLEIERKTTNEAASAGQVTNQLIAALATVATGQKVRPEGITARDLGLQP